MKDFYIILPSNSCPKVHPENHASKYTVSWDNAIEIDEINKWKVAVTEFNFNHISKSVNSNLAVEYYTREKSQYCFALDLEVQKLPNVQYHAPFPQGDNPPWDMWTELEVYKKNNKLHLISRFKTQIDFDDETQAQLFGFSSKSIKSSEKTLFHHEIISEKELVKNTEKSHMCQILVTYYSREFSQYHTFNFDENVHWNSPTEMAISFLSNIPEVFKFFKYDRDSNRMQFVMQPNIISISLMGGLNFVLGFNQSYHNNIDGYGKPKEFIFAEHSPQLDRGINNLYIYSSICAPIQVGDVRVPLLKSVWLDINKRVSKFGEMKHLDVKNPMYVPINNSSINSVEINIRADSGQLIPFVEGSVTSITLHFKKHE
jgi:hypothetical protein